MRISWTGDQLSVRRVRLKARTIQRDKDRTRCRTMHRGKPVDHHQRWKKKETVEDTSVHPKHSIRFPRPFRLYSALLPLLIASFERHRFDLSRLTTFLRENEKRRRSGILSWPSDVHARLAVERMRAAPRHVYSPMRRARIELHCLSEEISSQGQHDRHCRHS
jgi:hypothetical protein